MSCSSYVTSHIYILGLFSEEFLRSSSLIQSNHQHTQLFFQVLEKGRSDIPLSFISVPPPNCTWLVYFINEQSYGSPGWCRTICCNFICLLGCRIPGAAVLKKVHTSASITWIPHHQVMLLQHLRRSHYKPDSTRMGSRSLKHNAFQYIESPSFSCQSLPGTE